MFNSLTPKQGPSKLNGHHSPEKLDMNQTAKALGITYSLLYQLKYDGKLPSLLRKAAPGIIEQFAVSQATSPVATSESHEKDVWHYAIMLKNGGFKEAATHLIKQEG